MGKLADRFGTAVRAQRRAMRLTQAQLAERTKLSEEWIRRVERGVGAPSFETVELIADALGVRLVELFGSDDANEPLRQSIALLLAPLDNERLRWIERLLIAALEHPAPRNGPSKPDE